NGVPSIVERTMVRPPSARIGPVTPAERKAVIDKSPIKGKYDTPVDSESAYEILQKRMQNSAAAPAPGQQGQAEQGGGGLLGPIGGAIGAIFGTNVPRRTRLSARPRLSREGTRSVTNRVPGPDDHAVG